MRGISATPILVLVLVGPAALAPRVNGLSAPGPLAAASTRTLSEDDNGGTVTLQTGDRLLIKLGGDWDWTLDPFDTGILKRVTGTGSLPHGAQALLEAKKAGKTKISLTGDPPCAKSRPPCNAPSRQFQATIV